MIRRTTVVLLTLVACAPAARGPFAAPTTLLPAASSDSIAPLAVYGVDASGRPRSVAPLGEHLHALTLVEFWATWCSPCAEALPQTARLVQEFDDLQWLTISLDDDPGAATEALAALDLHPSLFFVADAATSARLRQLPTTLIVDASGEVLARHSGYDQHSTARLRRDLTTLTEASLGPR